MEQEKFGKFIKEVRKNNNLTQKELADKYGVTYQAVSKWENGKNMPDIMLIKQMCEDFDIQLSDMFEGEYKTSKKSNKNNWMLYAIFILIVIFIILVFLLIKSNTDGNFKFKTLSTGCEDFNIFGSIAYNQNKSSIYISHVNYCGGEDQEEYKKIECILYESYKNTDIKISSCEFNDDTSIKLEDYLQDVKINVDNYESVCRDYKDSSLYLLINATDSKNKVRSYKIPLILEEICSDT